MSKLPSEQTHHVHDEVPSSPPRTPELFIVDKDIFRLERRMNPNPSMPPLMQPKRAFGKVVPLAKNPVAGTGKGYRNHVPLTVHLRVNDTDGRVMSSLLDTGASLSVIDADLLRRLGGQPKGEPMTIHGLGDQQTLGWATLPVFIDATDPHGRHVHLEAEHDFHVLTGFAPGLCLGLDFIAQYELSISPVRGRGRIGRYTFQMNEKLPSSYAKTAELCTAAAISIDPDTQVWVPVNASCLAPHVDYTVFPRLSATPDELVLLTGPAGLLTHQPVRHIFLGNYGSTSITLEPGTVVADAFAAEVGDAFSMSSEMFTLPVSEELPSSSSIPDPPPPDDVDVAIPYDAFEASDPVASGLSQDAATVLVDDAFRVGIAEDGQGHAPLVDLLRRHRAAFALDGRPGRVEGDDMEIKLRDDAVLRSEAPRRASPEKRRAMDTAIDQLLDWDVIEPSKAPVSFPVVMVRQNGKWRFCVDYRHLNAQTVPDRYPLPTIDAVFQTLCGKKIFSSLDAIRGYHQLGVKTDDRWKTAFVCHRGLFQYKRVPFGLRNAPAIFQRFMDKVLGPLRWFQAVVYIDDAVVATDTMSEHVEALDTLLRSATDVGLKFSPAKCTFGIPSLVLLGRKVSGAGVAIWSDRAKAVQDLSRPTTLQELYHTLGLFGYYRAFIPRFAEIAAPLTRLLKGWRYETADGQTRLTNTEGKPVTASRVPIPWAEQQQHCFETLKHAIANPPVLAHPDPSKPYILYTDASKDALAAILHQTPGAVDEEWVLRDEILVRRVDDRVGLPESAIPTVMRAVHDGQGHFGFMKSYLAVKRHFWRPHLSTMVRVWVKHCPVCQHTKQAPKTGSLDISKDPSLPFEAVYFDIIYGFPRSQAGNDAVVVIQDLFSRMIMLAPCHKDITAEGVAAILSDRVLRMGWRPRRLVSDSEARVSGSVMTAVAASLGATMTPSSPYHQQANAVERAAQTVQQVLRAMSQETKAHWDRRALPSVELAMNSTPSLTTGYRPFDLVFLSHPDVVHAVFDAAEHLGVSSFDERLGAAQERLRDAQDNILAARQGQKRRYDARRATPPVLAPGMMVWIRLRDRPVAGTILEKLDTRKLWPYPIKEVLSPHRVRVRIPEHLKIDPVFSIEQLDFAPLDDDPYAPERHRSQIAASHPPPTGSSSSTVVAPLPLSEAGMEAESTEPIEGADIAETPARERRPPRALRDFQPGTLRSPRPSELEDALRGPIGRPKRVWDGEKEVLLTERPVAFLSRLTTVGESKLAAAESELVCLAWAFHKLAHLLEGAFVTVVTDHSPMERMLRSTATITYGPTITRCRAQLMPHLPNMRFQYGQGSHHTNADALSRLPPDQGRSASGGGDVLD
ncbi:hypothetical protein A4X13_0g6512 [Tilletia indica]|uniref:RNA-directed DNA polymerase n=1 Tax=Tilletia indica TaxID=43049 RepID=A0A8T8SPG3_9BASI|nr:hypothetical protein A4X13_0g6512 [Tilletia indica]